MIAMPATKSASFDKLPSRRDVFALLGGCAVALSIIPAWAKADHQEESFLLHEGWVLRSDDIARLRRP
jgi:hypothetical protein